MEIYKIKNMKTGLYSRGGFYPTYSKSGKIWKRKCDLSNHLTLAADTESYKDCVIEVLRVEEVPVEYLTIEEYYMPVQERREKADAARELRYQQITADLKRLNDLQAKIC